ncbi:hypothetical protein PMI04_019495 [Sphingobium sp. AP49]|uniref:hypothetical protein n=1 Tax=Sphingobium sp. AP49 TaxID=1144307 RepID=UPI000305C3ED|nr:hypothetical protein [Sphingobium sp. AP49]WHO38695.1 hypothetical protein PMI04_019495 [Sphingobium sp. AP49]
MMERNCYAAADTPRAIMALLFPIAAVLAVIWDLGAKGFSVREYPELLITGHLSWFRQGVGWLALLLWVLRYYPPAWIALWHGRCLVTADQSTFFIAGSPPIDRAQIISVRLRRGLLRKDLEIKTADRAVAISQIFLRTTSELPLDTLMQQKS